MPHFIYSVQSTLTRLLATASKGNSYTQNPLCFGYVDENMNTRKLKESADSVTQCQENTGVRPYSPNHGVWCGANRADYSAAAPPDRPSAETRALARICSYRDLSMELGRHPLNFSAYLHSY